MERERDRDFKELAHEIVGTTSLKFLEKARRIDTP